MKFFKWIGPICFFLFLIFYHCDTRKPIEFEGGQPQLELSGDTVITFYKSRVDTLTAVVLTPSRGAIDSGGVVHFTARGQLGFISEVMPILGGTAIAYYHPKENSSVYYDTIRAWFAYNNNYDTAHAMLIIKVLPALQVSSDEVGSIELVTSDYSVQVRSSGGDEQATITARVLDVFGNPIKDGVRVTFQIVGGPGGGENLNNRGLQDTASTAGGKAQVTFNSGSKIGVVEILAQSGTRSVQARLLSISSGPPSHIDIDPLENKVIKEGGRWKLYLNAVVTDTFSNPVQDSVSVLFTIAPFYLDTIIARIDTLDTLFAPETLGFQIIPNGETTYICDTVWAQDTIRPPLEKMSIQNSAATGIRICPTCDSIPGTAVSFLTYDSEVIYDTIQVEAVTVVGGQIIKGTCRVVLPLPPVVLTARYSGGALDVPDTACVVARLADDENYPIQGARLCANSEGGVILDTGSVRQACGQTDANGEVLFMIKFVLQDQVDDATFFQTNKVTITETTRGGTAQISFQLKFK